MELIAPLSKDNIAEKSYHLFQVVMQASVSHAYSEEKKWDASRLAMHGAYKSDKFLPSVEDPHNILAFLEHHFDLATSGGKGQDGPIQDALYALAYASGPTATEALEDFDPTNPSFVRGICCAFQDNKPFELRKAALFFLPRISDKLFNTPQPIMKPDEMKGFCADWASTVDNMEFSDEVKVATLTALFGMINSPHWRPHIVAEKWKLLENFGSVPCDSQPFKRCIDNPELIDAIKEVGGPAASYIWLAILWLKYKELIPQVRTKLEAITAEVAQGRRRMELDNYLTMIDSELKKAEEALTRYDTWSANPNAVALRTKIESLGEAKSTLISLRRS